MLRQIVELIKVDDLVEGIAGCQFRLDRLAETLGRVGTVGVSGARGAGIIRQIGYGIVRRCVARGLCRPPR